jgi:hypothetical protein
MIAEATSTGTTQTELLPQPVIVRAFTLARTDQFGDLKL